MQKMMLPQPQQEFLIKNKIKSTLTFKFGCSVLKATCFFLFFCRQENTLDSEGN